ncbi:hypothetical protein [Saccharopolyspora taberi]|uniref:Uncharacterized protein n=1 Tax=Saccharopolyspora taberi TaxID=60895 RepID=A0ABN3V7Z1_9PSEU
MARRTPQEKKRLSYAKDRRNDYGENDKSSRKNIRRNRRIAHRTNRRVTDQALRAAIGRADETAADDVEQAVRSRRPLVFRKWRDAPLSQIVDYKLRRRLRLGIDQGAHERIERLRENSKPVR